MNTVQSGDRVQVRCSSSLEDGTLLEIEQNDPTPYWIRTGQPKKLKMISDTLLGMEVGEQKTMTVRPCDGLGKRVLVHRITVVAIRRSDIAARQ